MASDTWNVDARKAFAIFAKLNWAFGLWPLLRDDLRLKIRMAMGIVQVTLMMVATLYEMFENCGDAEDFVDNLLVLSASVISLTKLIIYHIHRDKLCKNIISAINDWSSIEMIDYRDIMMSYERIYKSITFVLLTVVFLCFSVHFLKILVIDADEMIVIGKYGETNLTFYVLKKRYLFPSTCTFNNVPESIYLILVLNQFLQMITYCIVAVGSDAFFLAITIHLCGQFEILKLRFASLDDNGNLELTTMRREKINALISRHQHLLRLTELLEDAYNKIVLVQLLTTVTLISVAGFGFLIALKTNDCFGTIKSLALIQYMLLQSFMYTCIGEALQSQGDYITQSVYDISWYDLPRYLSKDLVFVMMRSNVSRHLTAGKFLNMTRVAFMNIVKTSSSYLSVLRIMLNE